MTQNEYESAAVRIVTTCGRRDESEAPTHYAAPRGIGSSASYGNPGSVVTGERGRSLSAVHEEDTEMQDVADEPRAPRNDNTDMPAEGAQAAHIARAALGRLNASATAAPTVQQAHEASNPVK